MTTTATDIEFRGKAGEWFGIWIVNILLSILTIGIYSAWAKVRTKKYFYQNTYISGRNFDYHATGGQILKGRLIVIGVFVLYSLLSSFAPLLGLVIGLGLALAVPFFILQSIKFNAAYSSWANVRFRFDGTVGDSYKNYLVFPILVALTFYTTLPFLWRRNARFVTNNHSLGQSRFAFDSGIGAYYWVFLWMIVAFGIGLILALPSILGIMALIDAGATDNEAVIVGMILPAYGIFLIALITGAVIGQAMMRNIWYNNLTLGTEQHRFQSTVSVWAYLWIVASNACVTVITLGLMSPWAQVRIARYLAEHTKILPNGDLDGFIGTIEADRSAFGDAYVDIEGLDVGIGL